MKGAGSRFAVPGESIRQPVVYRAFLIFGAVSFIRVRVNKHLPSIGTQFLKEARSLIKVCYEQKDYASYNTFISASQGSGRIIDVFWPLFDLKIMVKNIKKRGKNKNRFEETPLIRRDGRKEGQLGIGDRRSNQCPALRNLVVE